MFSRFFINRPIFSTVLSVLIFAVGLVALFHLPIEQFPQITPPTVTIATRYPGANAETVAQSVAAPIEQELSGAQGLLYNQSYSGNDGSLSITATFEVGTDLDIAAVEVQNRVNRAEARLPEEVTRQGITVAKASNSILMVASLRSSNPDHDNVFLANYAQINMLDTIKRVPGIGDARVFGAQDYAMRAWLNPDLLASKGLTIGDVAEAMREQNAVYAAGRIGGEPNAKSNTMTLPVVTPGRLRKPQEFARIILRANNDGTILHLDDVARIELSSQAFDLEGRQDGEPTALMVTYLQPNANALEAAQNFESALVELAKNFPEGVHYELPYTTTPFIEAGIHEVGHTFTLAALLVSLVVLLFLGTWRATLIPLIAVPVSIIGAAGGMYALGFSINTLTLFGLVLAIGIVVDDAIIVVENVERLMTEEKLPARQAAFKAMQQVSGPLVAIVLVLSAVFIPVAFLGGLTGELYRQFAVTIAVSVLISGLVALTLSPALAAILLRKGHGHKIFLFRWFDTIFEGFTGIYRGMVRLSLRFIFVPILLFLTMIGFTIKWFNETPTGFIPQEDQGYFIVAIILPPGTALDVTREVMKDVEKFILAQPEVDHTVSMVGADILAGFSPNTSSGLLFAPLIPWDKRQGPDHHVTALLGRVGAHFGARPDAIVIPINPPPVRGLGIRSGFEVQLQDRAGRDIRDLSKVKDDFIAALNASPKLHNAITTFNVAAPQLYAELDRQTAKLRGVSVDEVYGTLQALLGSLYVNDFVEQGRIFQVLLGTESPYRDEPSDIGRIFVRNKDGEMVSLSNLVHTEYRGGPSIVSRFNGFPSVQMTGEPAPGVSSGDAIKEVERIAAEKLPAGYAISWSGTSYQEIKAGSQALGVIGMGLFVVFLVLCALYEKWSLPLAVLLGVPAGAFGAIVALQLRGIPKDIYFQVGLLTLIGLAAKNAILIVEFAAELHRSGLKIVEAAVEAARVRLRPFVMTSLAFILGVLPLFLATGAGAAGRRSIGTGVVGGMIAATLLDMLFVPMLFVIVTWCSEKGSEITAHLLGTDAEHHARVAAAAPDAAAESRPVEA